MKFDYVRSVRDTRTHVCTYDLFQQLTRLESVAAAIAAFRAGDAEAKKRLPAFCFHAHFGGKRRAVENAVLFLFSKKSKVKSQLGLKCMCTMSALGGVFSFFAATTYTSKNNTPWFTEHTFRA